MKYAFFIENYTQLFAKSGALGFYTKYSIFILSSLLITALVLGLISSSSAIKKLLLLGLSSVVIVLYWAVMIGEFYYVYLGYLVAFTGAVLMLFLSVVLMLPAVADKFEKSTTIMKMVIIFAILFFGAGFGQDRVGRQNVRKDSRILSPLGSSPFYTFRITLRLLITTSTELFKLLKLFVPVRLLLDWGEELGHVVAVKKYIQGVRSLIHIYRDGGDQMGQLVQLLVGADKMRDHFTRLPYALSGGRFFKSDFLYLVFAVSKTAFDRAFQQVLMDIDAHQLKINRVWIKFKPRGQDSPVNDKKNSRLNSFFCTLPLLIATGVIYLNFFISAIPGKIAFGTTTGSYLQKTTNEHGLLEIFMYIYQYEPTLLVLTALVLLVAIIGAAIFFKKR